MTNQIVTVNVSQNQAPAPSSLQRTGAFISQGGTNNAPNTLSLITQQSDLTAILAVPFAISTLTWSGNVVTATAVTPHGYTIGDTFPLTIAGAQPTGYNGTFPATITGTTTFTYPLLQDPSTETVPGTYTPASRGELIRMGNSFFAQGALLSVYVLELGAGTVAEGCANLQTWIVANPLTVYSYLIPANWDAATQYTDLVALYQSTSALTYFYTTTTNDNYDAYTAQDKSVYTVIPSPNQTALEFSCASHFYDSLVADPSSTNKVQQLAFRYQFGTSPWPLPGNGPKFSAWKAAGVNWTTTGAEGGISTSMIKWGTFMDTRPWQYWYSIDWMQINIALQVSAEVINGSNNPINPLILNQQGINRVQATAASVCSSAVTFGLAVGTVIQTELSGPDFTAALDAGKYAGQIVVNAVPFVDYYTANPDDYRPGIYNGLSITYIPARGFTQITFNVNASDFVTS